MTNQPESRLARHVARLETLVDNLAARVALLEHATDPAWAPADTPTRTRPVPGWEPAPGWTPGTTITPGQLRRLHQTCRNMTRPERTAWATAVLGRRINTFKDLTRPEAATLINRQANTAT